MMGVIIILVCRCMARVADAWESLTSQGMECRYVHEQNDCERVETNVVVEHT